MFLDKFFGLVRRGSIVFGLVYFGLYSLLFGIVYILLFFKWV